jgi:hypothetical protein
LFHSKIILLIGIVLCLGTIPNDLAESLAIVPGTIPKVSIVADSAEATGLKWAAPAGGGKVLQVIYGEVSTVQSNSTSTYADTGLTATITPSSASSKVLIIYGQQGLLKSAANGDNRVAIRLLRGATVIHTPGDLYSFTGTALQVYGESVAGSYLDTPSTTSATTYKTQFANTNNTAAVQVQANGQFTSSITLLEIGA